MHRTAMLALALVMGLTASAQADLSITFGNHPYPIGTGLVTIPIAIGGSAADITQTNINIEIARTDFVTGGGNFPSGPSPIIGFDGQPTDVNGNFMAATTHLFGDAGSDSWNIDVFENLANPNAPISNTANGGLLINLTVDFTGFNSAPGSWLIILDAANGNGATNFGRVDNSLITTTITNGTVSIVPEPTSVVLGLFAAAGLGLVAIRKRRARRA